MPTEFDRYLPPSPLILPCPPRCMLVDFDIMNIWGFADSEEPAFWETDDCPDCGRMFGMLWDWMSGEWVMEPYIMAEPIGPASSAEPTTEQ